jgi:ornithine cyclodeaminase/alanine dehydrogenase-like protein (mu-crystallin family)
MRMIDATEVRRLLTFQLLVEALQAAHRRPRMAAQDTFMGEETALYLAPGRIEGRKTPDDITLFKNAGGGHLDLMTAEVVFGRAMTEVG